MILKSRILATKQQERQAGDFSVSVDRSGKHSLRYSIAHAHPPQVSLKVVLEGLFTYSCIL